MYNLLSKYRKKIIRTIYVILLIIPCLIIYSGITSTIFKEPNVYFYTSSTIVQGFVALAALLGTVIIFKIQLEDQSMQRLSDSVIDTISNYRSYALSVSYTPVQMMQTCKEILENNERIDDDDNNIILIKKIYNQMKDTYSTRTEIRSALVDFVTYSFFNVGIALISIFLTPIFVLHWYIGGFLLYANICFSVFILSKATQLVKKSVGYDFHI